MDALGNPIRFKLSGGEEADCSWAIPALTDLEFGCLLADKGYDTDEILSFLKDRGVTACIPPKENPTIQREYDKELYKERNLVERFFNKLKQFRRLATRYEKTARNFRAMLIFAATIIWMA